MRAFSVYQQAIFADVETGTGHTVVLARAGCGKTTTIEECVRRVPKSETVLLVAFNKSIARELEERVRAANVTVSTLHSFGLRAVTAKLGRARIDDRKVPGIVKDLLDARLPECLQTMLDDQGETSEYQEERRDYERSLTKCVGLAKGNLASTPADVDAIIDQHSVIPPNFDEARSDFIKIVLRTLEICAEEVDVIDFDDMIWLPAVRKLQPAKFDRVFIDETQDLNRAQIDLALKACKKGGRIVAVGDDRQAIYGFRGADSSAVQNVTEALSAKVLPLSITYRCGKAIVDLARRYVPDFEAAETAPAGVVRSAVVDAALAQAAPGDFILSRSNAPLVSMCMDLLRQGKRANIQGSDIGAKLAGMVKRSKAKTVPAFTAWTEEWLARECKRLQERDRDTKSTEDTAACLLTLCEDAETIKDVLAKIERLFADTDSKNIILLSSTHKAKGLERDRVWCLSWTYLKSRPNQTPDQAREEENLFYVAVTRAKTELVMVEEKKVA